MQSVSKDQQLFCLKKHDQAALDVEEKIHQDYQIST